MAQVCITELSCPHKKKKKKPKALAMAIGKTLEKKRSRNVKRNTLSHKKPRPTNLIQEKRGPKRKLTESPERGHSKGSTFTPMWEPRVNPRGKSARLRSVSATREKNHKKAPGQRDKSGLHADPVGKKGNPRSLQLLGIIGRARNVPVKLITKKKETSAPRKELNECPYLDGL